ncbi:hypothetical protein B7P43_G08371, partial [Cryptotermes secundus]
FTQHLSVLNLQLQGKKQTIYQMVGFVDSFRKRLHLFKSALNKNNLLHFPCCRKLSEEEGLEFRDYPEIIEDLSSEFDRQFNDFESFRSDISLFNNPIHFDIESQPGHLQQIDRIKQTMHRVHMERFNLKKLNKVEGKEEYCVEISNRFAALENSDTEVDVNKAWETNRENLIFHIRENIKMSAKESLDYYEPKKHKPWFDEGCSKLLDHRKQAKLQWLQDPSELNGNNLNNIRRETSRHFRNKKRDYLKDKIDELAMNSKNKNIRELYRGININITETTYSCQFEYVFCNQQACNTGQSLTLLWPLAP